MGFKTIDLGLKSALILIILACSFSAQGEMTDRHYRTYWHDFVVLLQNRGRSMRKECNDNPHRDVRASNIEQALQNARNTRGCRSVRYYQGIIEHGNQEYRQVARREIIDSYIEGDDPYGIMNAATFYVGLYGVNGWESAAVIEEIRFKILNSIETYFHTNAGRDPFWEKMVLGVHSKQSSQNPLFQFYRADLFLRDYPRSSHTSRVRSIQREAERHVENHYMEPNNFLRRNKEWKAIIIRMAPIWQLDDDSPIYGPALEISVEAFINLARDMAIVRRDGVIRRPLNQTKKRITENTVRGWLEIGPNDPLDWDKEIGFMMEQAITLVEFMERSLPGQDSTRNARRMYNTAIGR